MTNENEAQEILKNVETEEEALPSNEDPEIIDLDAEELKVDNSEEAMDLYSEFSSFLEKTTEIKGDTGIKQTISTGIDLLDAILGGGFAIGALSIIVGQPGSGKSMLAIQTMGAGERQYKGKMIPLFLDSEEATTKIRLSNLGVNYPPIEPISDITVEKVFKVIEGVCLFKQEKDILDTPSMVVWDSIANTLCQAEIEADDINQVIGRKARTLSLLIPKYVAKCCSE